jgi:hypothetical protein
VTEQTLAYPAKLQIDYPDRNLDRLTTFFRMFTIIPIYLIFTLLMSSYGAGFILIPAILMILFQQKYPRWWFDWNLALTKFCYRIAVYLYLMTDVYPSTDEDQSVHMDIQYPDAKKDINRWLPLVKWFLAIPHYVVLYCLMIAVCISVIIAWFAILINRRFPRGIFIFIESVMRWSLRVSAYTVLLTTDIYPPFSLD